MTAKVICIGDELLCGNTLNTNLLFLGERLAASGYQLEEELCVPDTEEAIRGALERCAGTDVVFLIGGLGPTRDDMTRPTVAEYLGRKLILDPAIRNRIVEYLGARGKTIPEIALTVQAEVPEGATPLLNANGTAPGLMLEGKGTLWFLMPGPPREMRPMFDSEVLPRVRKHFPPAWRECCFHVVGVGESVVEEKVRASLGEKAGFFHLAYCIKEDNVEVRIGLPAGCSGCEAHLHWASDRMKDCFGVRLLPEDCRTAVEYLAELLLKQGKTLATAESCTGGGIAAALTDLPGASRWFHGAFVTYTNAWKEQFLGVSPEVLKKYGAVSEQTVSGMLEGVFARTEADYAIAVSGIAGPDGGSAEKPVGTVVVGVASRQGSRVQTFLFHGGRDTVRARTVATGISQLIQLICDTLHLQ